MPLYGKVLEVRDRSTFIPVLAVRMWHPRQPAVYYLHRCGYEKETTTVMLTRLDGAYPYLAYTDPGQWDDRTMTVAHLIVQRDWDKLGDGSIVDVQFELKETKRPQISERFSV